MIRREWGQLPGGVRDKIVGKCGHVLAEVSAPAGRNSEFSATLQVQDRTGPAGRVFVKGITVDHPAARMHRHEAYINRWLPAVAPRLRWQIESDGWLMLGFDHVDGSHADLSPGSPDLPLVAATVSVMNGALNRCTAENVPVLADQWAHLAAWRRLRHDTPDDLDPWSRSNVDSFVKWELQALELIRGPALLHTDLHSLNILVDQSARVVDWAWSRRGAPWIDVGFLVLRLIQAGHTPGEAADWAETVPAWSEASETARTAFAVAVLGIWEFLQRDHPLPHRESLTNAARQWARHRLE